MNTKTTHNDRTSTTPTAQVLNFVAPTRHQHRERDFGVGYGNSSGYASTRRYTAEWTQPRFRVA